MCPTYNHLSIQSNNFFESKRLSTNFVSVDFSVLLSRFLVLFAGVVSNFVYNPRKKNQKAAKIIQKFDETEVRRQSLRTGDRNWIDVAMISPFHMMGLHLACNF